MLRWGTDRAVLVIKKTARWARIRLKIPTIGQESGRGYLKAGTGIVTLFGQID